MPLVNHYAAPTDNEPSHLRMELNVEVPVSVSTAHAPSVPGMM